MKKLVVILFLTGLFLDAGAQITRKNLDLPDFNSIYVNSGYTVNLTQSNKQEVELVALNELVDVSEFEVKDGVLHVNVNRTNDGKNKSMWEKIDNIKISPEMTLNINMRNIKVLRVNGSGKIVGQNSIAASNISIGVAGSGTIDVDLKGDNVDTELTGTGKIILKGYANHNDIMLAGTGNLEAFECELVTADVNLSGTGTCELFVSDKLDVNIMGSGSVIHKGQTKSVTKAVMGRGKVERDY